MIAMFNITSAQFAASGFNARFDFNLGRGGASANAAATAGAGNGAPIGGADIRFVLTSTVRPTITTTRRDARFD
uniref:Uncharacterized protein n=1 Tax=Tetranychus urticae TaxID=32264 RepID=T1K0U9_TETUR